VTFMTEEGIYQPSIAYGPDPLMDASVKRWFSFSFSPMV
jgi:hypothetical protein